MAALWLIVTATSILGYLIYKYVFSKKAIPGPRGLPIIGNVHQIDQVRPFVTLTDWSKVYGSVYSVYTFTQHHLVLSSYDAIREVLTRPGSDFSGRPDVFRSKFLFPEGDILTADITIPHVKPLRETVIRSLKDNKNSSLGLQRIGDVTSEYVEQVMEALKNLNGKPEDLHDRLYNFTVKVMIYFVLGHDAKTDDDEVLQLLKKGEHAARPALSVGGDGLVLDTFPWMRYIYTFPIINIMKEAKRCFDKAWSISYPKLKETYSPENLQCILHHAMLRQSELGDAIIPENALKYLMFDLVAAGVSATTTSLYGFLKILAKKPEVQQNILREVQGIVTSTERITWKHYDLMPYTRAAIFEVFRYGSAVPFVPRKALQDTHIGNYSVSKGTSVFLNTFAMHHDEEFWSDPWEYQPERFLDEQGNLLPINHDKMKHVITFGGGNRSCPGEVFSKFRIFLFVTALVQQFEMLPEDDDVDLDIDPRHNESGLALKTMPYKVKLIPRENKHI